MLGLALTLDGNFVWGDLSSDIRNKWPSFYTPCITCEFNRTHRYSHERQNMQKTISDLVPILRALPQKTEEDSGGRLQRRETIREKNKQGCTQRQWAAGLPLTLACRWHGECLHNVNLDYIEKCLVAVSSNTPLQVSYLVPR